MQYRIFEANMERLEKKLQRIANKCKKYGNDFTYEKIGEEYEIRDNEDNTKEVVKYIIIEASGKAIINDWQFVASVEHTENGNIIKKCCEIEVPERYYTSDSICEHCNSKRYRKDTFIVYNTVSGEFKQVGKSCLMDFTNGMSAEGIAHYISLFDELIEGEAITAGSSYTRYIETVEAMQYIAETIKHFGYIRSEETRPTKQRAREYFEVEHGMISGYFMEKYIQELRKEIASVSFNAKSDYAKELTEKVIAWIEEQEESNNYFHNLKTVCSLQYITFENFGLLASVFPAYDRELIREKQREEEQAKAKKSEYVGNVGDRITVQIADFSIVTSWETQYGMTYIYKIVDIDGNIYTWKTSGGIAEETKAIVATVKAHNEYRGTKQTELTRCRVKG